MKKMCELITTMAVIALVVAMCTLDGNPILSIITILISGAWIVVYSWVYEEERRVRGGRW